MVKVTNTIIRTARAIEEIQRLWLRKIEIEENKILQKMQSLIVQ